MDKFEKIVYISHPYSGEAKNKRRVTHIFKTVSKDFPNICFLSPIHSFDVLYNEFPYEVGINYCLKMLSLCDEMWQFGDWQSSRGCKKEANFCKRHGIPYYEMDLLNISARE